MFSLEIAGGIFGFELKKCSFFRDRYKSFLSKRIPSDIIRIPEYRNLREIRTDNFLRRYFVSTGLKKGFLFLHSSAILFKGKGLLFIGKSRIRKIFKRGYSDELNIINGKFIYPSPFYSERKSNIFEKKKIFKVFFLKRGKENIVISLREKEYFKMFLKNVFLPIKTDRFDVIFKIWDNIKNVPAYMLGLKNGFKKGDLIELLERGT